MVSKLTSTDLVLIFMCINIGLLKFYIHVVLKKFVRDEDIINNLLNILIEKKSKRCFGYLSLPSPSHILHNVRSVILIEIVPAIFRLERDRCLSKLYYSWKFDLYDIQLRQNIYCSICKSPLLCGSLLVFFLTFFLVYLLPLIKSSAQQSITI